MPRNNVITAAIVGIGLVLGGVLLVTGGEDAHDHDHEHGHNDAHDDHAAEEFERGPHDGRLLRSDNFAVEITLFETGVPPEFRIYPYVDDKPVDPAQVGLAIELNRLGGRVDKFRFTREGTFLRGQGTVEEPHSFDVKVTASHGGKTHSWTYASYEGRTEMAADAANAAGVAVGQAGPARIRAIVHATGQVELDPTRSASVKARFPGVVREIRYRLGDKVAKGDTLALIDSNDSLQTYAVRSPVDGTVIRQDVRIGEMAGDQTLFEVADTSSLVGAIHVFAVDASKVAAGQQIAVKSVDGGSTATARVQTVLPHLDPRLQAVPVRFALENADGFWRAGMLIEAEITVGEKEVPLAVAAGALQKFRDHDVVYAKYGNTYEVRMLELGDRDRDQVEVLGGIDPGTAYVTENSFLIKADIEKSGASHDH